MANSYPEIDTSVTNNGFFGKDVPIFPQITFQAVSYDPVEFASRSFPGISRDEALRQLQNQTIYVEGWPFPLKHGDLFTLYGTAAIEAQKSNKYHVISVYFGVPTETLPLPLSTGYPPTPTPTPNPTSTPVPTANPTSTPAPSASPAATPVPTNTSGPMPTPTPSATSNPNVSVGLPLVGTTSTINGVTLTATGAGDTYNSNWSSCSPPITITAPCLWLGKTAGTYTCVFSVPQNDIVIFANASDSGENFTFGVDAGTLTLSTVRTCGSSISGTTVSSVGSNVGWSVKLTSTLPYTTMTIYSAVSTSGSLFGIYADSIVSSPTPSATPAAATATPIPSASATPVPTPTPTPSPGPFYTTDNILYLDAGNPVSYPSTGSTWYDLSTQENDASLSAVTYSTESTGIMNFDGTSSFGSLTPSKYNVVYSGKTVVVAARLAAHMTNNSHRAFLGDPEPARRDFNLYLNRTSSGDYRLHFSAGTYGTHSSNISVTPGQWFIVSVTHSTDGTVNYYMNGVLVSTTSQIFTQSTGNSGSEYVGRADNNWDGDIGVLAVYKNALSAADIAQNYFSIIRRYENPSSTPVPTPTVPVPSATPAPSPSATPVATVTPNPTPSPTVTPQPDQAYSLFSFGYGISGNNTGLVLNSSPIMVGRTNQDWKQLSFSNSSDHFFGIQSDGSLWGFGTNAAGQLGNNTVVNTSSPSQLLHPNAKQWERVKCGNLSTFAIDESGNMWAWGNDGLGCLGLSTNNIHRSTPVMLGTDTTWTDVVVGDYYCNALKTDGSMWSWGYNASGTFGANNSVNNSSPIQEITYSSWKSVAATRFNTTYGIKTNGSLWVVGRNYRGSLGFASAVVALSSFVQIGSENNWSKVVGNNNGAIALKDDGTLWSWGENINGVLGLSSTAHFSSPTQIGTANDWVDVITNKYASYALKQDSSLWHWGDGTALGTGNFVHRSSPVQTLKSDKLWFKFGCTRYGFFGTRGLIPATPTSTPVPSATPAPSPTPSPTVAPLCLTASNNVTITSQSFGNAYTFNGSYGVYGINLGTYTFLNVPSGHPIAFLNNGMTADIQYTGTTNAGTSTGPDGNSYTFYYGTVTLTVLNPFSSLSYACLYHGYMGGQNNIVYTPSCSTPAPSATPAMPTPTPTPFAGGAGNLYMWGWNGYGQLGINSVINQSSPVQELTQSSWKYLNQHPYTGAFSGIKTDGTAWVWGANTVAGNGGQLGVNDVAHRSSPVQTLVGGNDWSVIIPGYDHAVGIKTNGTMWTWGSNLQGQLGKTGVSTSSPAQLGTDTNWLDASIGYRYTVALKTDNTLWAWGYNAYGNLGQGDKIHRSSPVQIIGSYTKISANYQTTSAIKTDGTLWSWGANGNGNCGDNTTISRSSPVQITSGGSWSFISAAGNTSGVAIKSDGTLWCWGSNASGSIGDNTIISKSSPVQTVAGGNNWVKALSNLQGITALKSDGTLWGWGLNNLGVLGTNDAINRSSPVQTIIADNKWVDIGVSANMAAGMRAVPTPSPTPV